MDGMGKPDGGAAMMRATEWMSDIQAAQAYEDGLSRSAACRARDAKTTYGYNPTAGQRAHTDGMACMAEQLAGLVTGRQWTSSGKRPDRRHEGDLEGGVGVRWTPRDNGNLLIHPDGVPGDPPGMPFILVRGDSYRALCVVAWAWAHEAQQERYWRTVKMGMREPCFVFPARRNVAELHINATPRIDFQDVVT